MTDLNNAPLGKETQYPSSYDAALLFPIARSAGREALNIPTTLPFTGVDNWTAYEVSWLDQNAKPCVAIAYFSFPCESPNIIESKSFKLYLNSFNFSRFNSQLDVETTMIADVSAACGATVKLNLLPINNAVHMVTQWPHESLDEQALLTLADEPDANLLQLTGERVTVKLQTDLFRSLCPVTAQPDWASIRIEYQGNEIDKASLLTYLVSYRKHQGFHEQCVEQIFQDLAQVSQAESLLVEARFLRRGGLDINPVRMKGVFGVNAGRLARQ